MASDGLWCRATILGPDGAVLASRVLEGPGPPDIGAVDQVASLVLLAGRLGGGVTLSEVCVALRELLGLAGQRGSRWRGSPKSGNSRSGSKSARKKLISAILPPEISIPCRAQGAYPPAGSSRYCPKAGQPLAEVATRREPRQPLGPGWTMKAPMAAAPWSHMAKGGIDCTASSCSSSTSRSMS